MAFGGRTHYGVFLVKTEDTFIFTTFFSAGYF